MWLRITYLFLKELVFVSDVFLLALLSHENLRSLPEVGIKSLFTVIDSSSDTAVSSTQLIYSFMSFFNLFIYFIVIANIYIHFFFQIDRLELFFTDSVFRFRFRFRFRIPDSGFQVLVLPL